MQQKRTGKILEEIRSTKNPLESARTRTSMLLAAKIIEARKAKGWNNIEFAKRLDKKPSVITRWQSGTHTFSSDTLSDIQEVLGIELLALDEKKKPVEQILKVVVEVNASTQHKPKRHPSKDESLAHAFISAAGGISASKIELSYTEQ